MSGKTTVMLKQRMTMTEGELLQAAIMLDAKGLLRGAEMQPGEKLVRVVLVLETPEATPDLDDATRSFDRLWDIARGER